MFQFSALPTFLHDIHWLLPLTLLPKSKQMLLWLKQTGENLDYPLSGCAPLLTSSA